MPISGVCLSPLPPVEILSQTRFFGDLDRERLRRIAEVSELQSYPAGTPIYRLGDAATSFYVLVEGMVRFVLGMDNRNAAAGTILRRWQVFGWAALTCNVNRRIATASCLTPCTILVIDAPCLTQLMETDHTLGFRVMKQVNLLITGALPSFAAG